jgi:hypothetical protein
MNSAQHRAVKIHLLDRFVSVPPSDRTRLRLRASIHEAAARRPDLERVIFAAASLPGGKAFLEALK